MEKEIGAEVVDPASPGGLITPRALGARLVGNLASMQVPFGRRSVWGRISSNPAIDRAWLPSLLAVVLAAIILALQGPNPPPALAGARALALAVAICLARGAVSRLPAPVVWLVLDAVATSSLVLLTGSWFSPYYLLLVAGIWWAAHGTWRWSGIGYAAIFIVLYGATALGASLASDALQEVLEDLILAAAIGVLADTHLHVDRRAMALTNALTDLQRGGRLATLHDRITSAASDVVLPVDSLLAGAQIGLKMHETELLGLLMLGLTNQQIADTSHVAEATVKYRLTHLYRHLGVRGRSQAIALGHRLGLELSDHETINVAMLGREKTSH